MAKRIKNIGILNNIKKVCIDAQSICIKNMRSDLCDSWMYEYDIYQKESNFKYYHLIYLYDNIEFRYNDICGLRIMLRYDKIFCKYLIRVSTTYSSDNEWFFGKDDFHKNYLYIMELIKTQYTSLQSLYSLIDLTKGNYMGEVESPVAMYKYVNNIQRKKKLELLCLK